MSEPVTLERNAKTPAPLEILPHCDPMDLLTFLRLGKRLRRLVTVLVFALRPRLANEYYTIDVNIYFEKKKWWLFFSCSAC